MVLSIKRTIGDTKHTISLETVSKSSAETSKTYETVTKMNDLKPSGETWAGEAKFFENGRMPNP